MNFELILNKILIAKLSYRTTKLRGNFLACKKAVSVFLTILLIIPLLSVSAYERISNSNALDWKEYFEQTNDLMYRTTQANFEHLKNNLDDEFAFARLIARTNQHELLMETNPTEYFFRYDGVSTLQFDSPREARVAYEWLKTFAGDNMCCSPLGNGYAIYWIHPDRPTESDIEMALALLNPSEELLAPMPRNIPYQPQRHTYPGGYTSWGSVRMGVHEYAQWLRDGNINHPDRVVIAIVDMGVCFRHPLFRDRRAAMDYYTPCMPLGSTSSHGDAVAGIAADLTRGLPVDIMSLNTIFFRGDQGIANANDWAANNGAHIINNSHTAARNTGVVCHAMTRALENNVMVVVSAGNAGADLATRAHYCSTGHIANGTKVVAAFNNNDTRRANSNFGTAVTFSAPGTDIYTAFSDFRATNPIYGNVITRHLYTFRHDTSMAAPHIAGAAALLLLNQPNLTPLEVIDALASASDFRRNPNIQNPSVRYGAGIPYMPLLITNDLPPSIPGDVNNDGVVNAADITLLRRYINSTNREEFLLDNPNFNRRNANVTPGGTITYDDVIAIRNIIRRSS